MDIWVVYELAKSVVPKDESGLENLGIGFGRCEGVVVVFFPLISSTRDFPFSLASDSKKNFLLSKTMMNEIKSFFKEPGGHNKGGRSHRRSAPLPDRPPMSSDDYQLTHHLGLQDAGRDSRNWSWYWHRPGG